MLDFSINYGIPCLVSIGYFYTNGIQDYRILFVGTVIIVRACASRVAQGRKCHFSLLFNIFIDDLMKKLDNHKYGLNIGDVIYNSFAYADDVFS